MADDKEKKPEVDPNAPPENPGPMQFVKVNEQMAQALGCKGVNGLKQALRDHGINIMIKREQGGLVIRGGDYVALRTKLMTEKYRAGDTPVLNRDPNRKKPSNRMV